MKNYTYTSAAGDAGIHPGMQTLLQTHWAPKHERGRQQNKGGVRWHTPLHWQSEPRIQCWFWVSKEQRKWACQLWDRSEQVYSNQRKLFSAHFKNENQKTFSEAHRMFWFLALKSAVSWHIHPSIHPFEKQLNKMLFVSQGNNWGRKYFVFNLMEFLFYLFFFFCIASEVREQTWRFLSVLLQPSGCVQLHLMKISSKFW